MSDCSVELENATRACGDLTSIGTEIRKQALALLKRARPVPAFRLFMGGELKRCANACGLSHKGVQQGRKFTAEAAECVQRSRVLLNTRAASAYPAINVLYLLFGGV